MSLSSFSSAAPQGDRRHMAGVLQENPGGFGGDIPEIPFTRDDNGGRHDLSGTTHFRTTAASLPPTDVGAGGLHGLAAPPLATNTLMSRPQLSSAMSFTTTRRRTMERLVLLCVFGASVVAFSAALAGRSIVPTRLFFVSEYDKEENSNSNTKNSRGFFWQRKTGEVDEGAGIRRGGGGRGGGNALESGTNSSEKSSSTDAHDDSSLQAFLERWRTRHEQTSEDVEKQDAYQEGNGTELSKDAEATANVTNVTNWEQQSIAGDHAHHSMGEQLGMQGEYTHHDMGDQQGMATDHSHHSMGQQQGMASDHTHHNVAEHQGMAPDHAQHSHAQHLTGEHQGMATDHEHHNTGEQQGIDTDDALQSLGKQPGGTDVQQLPQEQMHSNRGPAFWSTEKSHPEPALNLPPELLFMAELSEMRKDEDVPLFWAVPFSSGTSMKTLLGSCLGLVQASNLGAQKGYDQNKSLKVMKMPGGIRFVNVNMFTNDGIERAKQMSIISRNVAEVFMTDHILETSAMFTPQNRGRMFALLRNPVKRIVGFFHHAQEASWDRVKYDPAMMSMTLDEYARSDLIDRESNWMTGVLSGQRREGKTGVVGPQHLETAKNILRRKCVIGLLDEKQRSFERFERYFGWNDEDDEDTPQGNQGGENTVSSRLLQEKPTRPSRQQKEQCKQDVFHTYEWLKEDAIEPENEIEHGSDTWRIIAEKNKYDVELYEYAQVLFEEQGKWLESH